MKRVALTLWLFLCSAAFAPSTDRPITGHRECYLQVSITTRNDAMPDYHDTF